jgi:hypothetical protein
MFTNPVTLIDETIAHLRGCADMLEVEFDPAIHRELTKDGRICRETHIAIQALLPLLREARATQLPPGMARRPTTASHCIDCD